MSPTRKKAALVEARLAGRPIHRVSYEQLVGDYDHATAKIQQFLGLEQAPVQPVTHQQNTQGLEHTLENFHEVAEYFTHTPYAEFFKP